MKSTLSIQFYEKGITFKVHVFNTISYRFEINFQQTIEQMTRKQNEILSEMFENKST